MAETITPTSPVQLREAITWAVADKVPLEIIGQGSKRAYGHTVAASHVLDLSKLTGILFYQPEELVISAHAGTTLAEIAAVLAENNQQFQFEPGDFPLLLGDGAGSRSGTLGGLVACNLSGPRRLKVGAARDHVLGFGAISGRGEDFKSGGRVMKNVTGFDLSKLMAGSFGTLAVMHTITLKAMPQPETTRTVIIACDDVSSAGQAMTAAMGSENEVSGAAWVPASLIAEIADDCKDAAILEIAAQSQNCLALRLEGPEQSVNWRADALSRLLGTIGEHAILPVADSLPLWQAIADVTPLQGRDGILWRISVPPASGAAVVGALRRLAGLGQLDVMLDWAGGLVWLECAQCDASMAAHIREIVQQAGGNATLVRAPEDIRREIPVFQPLSPEIVRVNQKISENFDPFGILNPGRMAPAHQGAGA
ncbi:glycolate oxidase subunit GlcE [Thalassospira sp. TSL5-1]|uniref:glycolate oxidase subunit GlcE n=1 Tax=Thalassospira sp. TSL5-1 TaxID=1544451 RepID=UPI000938E3C4|nr:glycolate oxidase subunit GlcE [Thalassospira sp. TSL5-1]OKH87775.1 glycolate oxidase [Thalassospira sp. TSL5-1]